MRALYDWYTETVTEREGEDAPSEHEKFRAGRIRDIVVLDGAESVLDVGCARGHLLAEFKALGLETYGVDIRDIMLDPEQRVYSNINDVPVKVDLITCIHTLEHMHYPVQELISMRKKLNDGGRIVVEVPSLGDVDDLRIVHPSLFTIWTLKRAMVSAGFIVRDIVQLHVQRIMGSGTLDLVLVAGGRYESHSMASVEGD
jgi:2-polyprenyl-3-methyl-5-hydroxy-6-metoxy-1,4-benzoquinol methylase